MSSNCLTNDHEKIHEQRSRQGDRRQKEGKKLSDRRERGRVGMVVGEAVAC